VQSQGRFPSAVRAPCSLRRCGLLFIYHHSKLELGQLLSFSLSHPALPPCLLPCPCAPPLSSLHQMSPDERAHKLTEFRILIKAVVADGKIHPSERRMVREFMAAEGVTVPELVEQLGANGWSKAEWEHGRKEGYHDAADAELAMKMKEMPALLRAANIKT